MTKSQENKTWVTHTHTHAEWIIERFCHKKNKQLRIRELQVIPKVYLFFFCSQFNLQNSNSIKYRMRDREREREEKKSNRQFENIFSNIEYNDHVCLVADWYSFFSFFLSYSSSFIIHFFFFCFIST